MGLALGCVALPEEPEPGAAHLGALVPFEGVLGQGDGPSLVASAGAAQMAATRSQSNARQARPGKDAPVGNLDGPFGDVVGWDVAHPETLA